MSNQEPTNNQQIQTELTIQMILTAWESHYKRIDKLFKTLSEEQLMNEVAPGRNRGVYLLGHQTAVTDHMLPLLGFGEKLYPELTKTFIDSPDNKELEMPSITKLLAYWDAVNTKLSNHINNMTTADWFQKHTAVSDEDFIKEPYRNKLNIIISRTNHQGYHIGQLVFLEKKKS